MWKSIQDKVLASLRSVGISLDTVVDSVYSCGALLAGDRNTSTDFSRILTITLGLIFTGKVSLVVILRNKKILPKTGVLKLSLLYFDPVILSDTSIEFFAMQGKNVFFPNFFQLEETGSRFRMLIIRGLKKGKIAIPIF